MKGEEHVTYATSWSYRELSRLDYPLLAYRYQRIAPRVSWMSRRFAHSQANSALEINLIDSILRLSKEILFNHKHPPFSSSNSPTRIPIELTELINQFQIWLQ